MLVTYGCLLTKMFPFPGWSNATFTVDLQEVEAMPCQYYTCAVALVIAGAVRLVMFRFMFCTRCFLDGNSIRGSKAEQKSGKKAELINP